MKKHTYSLEEWFQELEKMMPSLKEEPGYFRYEASGCAGVARWIERYQAIIDRHAHSLNGEFSIVGFDLETTGACVLLKTY